MNSNPKELKDGDFVIPGQKIGVIEMYFPGQGTYEDNGKIFASLMGELRINRRERIISVEANKQISIPKPNDIVVGRVHTIKRQVAIVDINNNNEFEPRANFSADLHISNVSKSYIDNISDVFKPFDLIRAKVISNKDTFFQITTARPSLGVILAYCCICGSVLKPKGKNLYCNNCNRFEQRKIAKDYGAMRL